MTSNSEQIVHQVQHDFQALVAYVIGPEARLHPAATVELTLFRRLLALGSSLLQLFFVTRAATRPAEPVTAPDGTKLSYHDQRETTYYSVFGKVHFARHAFGAPGHALFYPLDAALSLPTRCYSDLLREWATYGTTDESYRSSQTVLEKILGVSLSIQAIETSVAEDAQDVDAFYAQPADPTLSSTVGTILVVQADGKGVPMVQPPADAPPLRLKKGQKRTKKKEAVVTSLYTIAPYRRTPQEVLAILLQEPNRVAARPRPVPVGKELHATLSGKAEAMTRLALRAAQRDGPHIQHRVALTDGAEALQQQLLSHVPHYTLVLDIIHATEYLWDTANALLGESHPGRTAWVKAYLEQVLDGRVDAVISALATIASTSALEDTPRKAVLRTMGYYERNQPYMRYQDYLSQGWPIGTGVVEGACGHLVKDRMEQSGMRWIEAGAQSILDLRAVRINGHWEAYWQFHRQQQHQRLYGPATPVVDVVETQLLQRAA